MKFNFNFFKKKKEESLDWIDETLKNGFFNNNNAVSYTHLTLPTTERV